MRGKKMCIKSGGSLNNVLYLDRIEEKKHRNERLIKIECVNFRADRGVKKGEKSNAPEAESGRCERPSPLHFMRSFALLRAPSRFNHSIHSALEPRSMHCLMNHAVQSVAFASHHSEDHHSAGIQLFISHPFPISSTHSSTSITFGASPRSKYS